MSPLLSKAPSMLACEVWDPTQPCQSWHVKVPDFGKNIWLPQWGRGKTYPMAFHQSSHIYPWLALGLASDWRPPCKLTTSSGNYDRHRHPTTTPKPHNTDGEMPWERVDKAKGWPRPARGSCQTSPGKWAIRSHLAWTHLRGITLLMHGQHCRRPKSLLHAPSSNTNCPSASFRRPYYGGRHTLGVEAIQPQMVRWDNRSRWASGCLPDTGEPLHQQRHDPMSRLPYISQGSSIDLVWWTPTQVIDSFDTLIKRFSAQYATIRSHRMASLWQSDDESLRKFMDKFGRTTIQIRILNPEVALHSMLLALRPGKFIGSLCKKAPKSIDELRKRAKGYLLMEEMSRLWNEVHQAGQKHNKHETNTKADLHKLDKRHKPDKR